jgi:predicted thioesterase
MPALPLNATATAEKIVSESDLASSLPSDPAADAFPPVFATPRLIGLMELASARLLRPVLGPGELSVGVSLDVVHTAATLPGTKVTATARYVGRDGELFVMKITASDPAGEIGRATHKRAIVSVDRLLAGAKKRAAKPGAL